MESTLEFWMRGLAPFDDLDVLRVGRDHLYGSQFPLKPADIIAPLSREALGFDPWEEEFERVRDLLSRQDGSLRQSRDCPAKTVALNMRSAIMGSTFENATIVRAQFRDAYERECSREISSERQGGALDPIRRAPRLTADRDEQRRIAGGEP